MKLLSKRTKSDVRLIRMRANSGVENFLEETPISSSNSSGYELENPVISFQEDVFVLEPPIPYTPRQSLSVPKPFEFSRTNETCNEEETKRQSTQTDPVSEAESVRTASLPIRKPVCVCSHVPNPKQLTRRKSIFSKFTACLLKPQRRILEVNLDDFSSVASSSFDPDDHASQSSSFYAKSRAGSCTSEYEISSAASFYTASDGKHYPIWRPSRSFRSDASAISSAASSASSNNSAVEELSYSTQNDATSQFTMNLTKENEEALRKLVEVRKPLLTINITDDHEKVPEIDKLAINNNFDNLSDFSSLVSNPTIKETVEELKPETPKKKKSFSLSRYGKSFFSSSSSSSSSSRNKKEHQPPPSYPPVPRIPSTILKPLEFITPPPSPLGRPSSHPVMRTPSPAKATTVIRYYSASELEGDRKELRSKSINIPFTEPHLNGEVVPVRLGTINTNFTKSAEIFSNPTTLTSRPAESFDGNDSFYDHLSFVQKSNSSVLETKGNLSVYPSYGGPACGQSQSQSIDSINYSVIYDGIPSSAEDYSMLREDPLSMNPSLKENAIFLENKYLGLSRKQSSDSFGKVPLRSYKKKFSPKFSMYSIDEDQPKRQETSIREIIEHGISEEQLLPSLSPRHISTYRMMEIDFNV